jgi:preprotein translocase subunit Sec61beta
MENGDEDKHPIALTPPYVIALALLAVGVILVGTVFAPWFDLSNLSALNLF